MGHSTIFVNQEVVYYILSGTPRSAQKCFWTNLRVEFSRENHLLLICGNIPNQTFWITKKLVSWLNSDLFKKKVCPNWTYLDCFKYHFLVIFWKWEPLLDSYNFGISGQIRTNFFLNRSEFNPESKYYVSCKVWFGIFPQINKRWFSPKNSTLRSVHKHFWGLLGVPDNM